MKLRNKKTGEIVRVEFLNNWQTDDGTEIGFRECNTRVVYSYDSLTELNADWEDYEEPKEIWYLDYDGLPYCEENPIEEEVQCIKEIGNYFETKEEAEKAVRKLKAWKRLEDKGFRFHEWYKPDGCEPFIVVETNIGLDDIDNKKLQKDLDLLFGGEE